MVRDFDASAIPAVYDLQEVPPRRDEPGLHQVMFRGIDQLVGVLWIGPEKADGEPHTHPFEQMNVLLEGRLDLHIDGERVPLEPFDALMIPPGTPHATRAVEGETATLLAFFPLREDCLDGTTYQAEFPEA